MPRDTVTGVTDEVAEARAAAEARALNERFAGATAQEVLRHALTDPAMGRIATVSSFGAESVVLLHMISQIDRAAPVLFIDTQMLFEETLQYQTDVAEQLGLTGIEVVRAPAPELAKADPDDSLHKRSTDACCDLRKTVPLANALLAYDGWVTGRKRFQAEARAALDYFESEGPRVKVNPLAGWSATDLKAYMDEHDLPRHPLVAKGYPSIGCWPCTTPVKEGEDPRAGRWRGEEKEECGIHFIDGKVVRGPLPVSEPASDPVAEAAPERKSA
ncbi:phosphoadenylyl-sulfate reductase [Vannielia litorea]|uniref:phosphoadenylyl-sulfate reductase n=1 Tax=Vannielia litorea TaxID=1217970 RepID=UPI001C94012F|nr:phosphoadenylyl-sulfate reductase [Vannielia litorea]MBY6152367.1 phosphoadenylyl-sulfate reductase [Vannielia litorea]